MYFVLCTHNSSVEKHESSKGGTQQCLKKVTHGEIEEDDEGQRS